MDRPFGNLPHEVCRALRWKSMFIDVPSDPTVPPSNDQIYWCEESQVCIGPDGQVAEPESCGPSRTCFDHLNKKFT